MNMKTFILGMAAIASVSLMRVCSAEPDKLTFIQDENFFLQDEVRKLNAELIDKDNAFKKLLLDKETLRYDLGVMVKEKEALEEKIGSFHKMVALCDQQISRHAEQAVIPYRSQLKDALGQLKVMTMTLEEKNVHLARRTSEIEMLQGQVSILVAEKTSLLQSIKKISGEYDALKGMLDDEISGVRADADKKIRDFQVRLAAEQTLVQEKIKQAKKPLEDKIVDMEAACKVREAKALEKGKLPEALSQEKVNKLEQQIVLLRQNAALEVKKVQDDSVAQINKLKDQLSHCSQAAQDGAAVKK